MKTGTLDAPARLAVTSTVGAPSDPALLRATSTLVRHERHLQGAVIDHLTEIEARRLYLRRGCSSLFDYTVRELGYRDAAAGRRIGAVRLCADQPDARERLRDGSLTLSAAAELQWAFDRQRRRGSIAGTASSAPAMPAGSAPENAVATEDPAAGSAPSGAAALDDSAADAAPHRTSAPPDSPPLVLDAAGRQKLVEEASGKSARQVRRMLADLDPDLAPPPDRVRPLGDGRYELKAVIDADCRHGLEQLRGLLSHVDQRMTIGQVVGRIVQEALDRHDPSRPPRRARTASRSAEGDCKPTSASKEQAAGNAVALRRRRMLRRTSTRLPQRSGRRVGRGNRAGREPRTAEPLPGRNRPPRLLRQRSRTRRVGPFRRHAPHGSRRIPEG